MPNKTLSLEEDISFICEDRNT